MSMGTGLLRKAMHTKRTANMLWRTPEDEHGARDAVHEHLWPVPRRPRDHRHKRLQGAIRICEARSHALGLCSGRSLAWQLARKYAKKQGIQWGSW